MIHRRRRRRRRLQTIHGHTAVRDLYGGMAVDFVVAVEGEEEEEEEEEVRMEEGEEEEGLCIGA
jgi:hypothetical protein